ncbi:ACE1 transcription factor [Coprinopsis cinerea AmutBmut pab1-1]|nr:ACE1 transcription factor [Coprinopsis cinerea AmutBmut pab1-1]
MVYVNDKKFACESCIKGHRSSSCHHTDRPLFEIKKKGRPVSQCTKCRELRKSKKVHSKCTCDNNSQKARKEQLVPLSTSSKTRRYIPIVPALPNGLKDALQSSKSPAIPADERQRVDSLLNPCTCQDVWNCKCQAAGPSSLAQQQPIAMKSPNPLEALAHVASLRRNEERSTSLSGTSRAGPSAPPTRKAKIPRPRPHSPQHHTSRKRAKPSSPGTSPVPLPDLGTPSMRIIAPGPVLPTTFPDFDVLPAASFATPCVDSGCTCGMQCACPGCIQHRGASHASADHKDCGEGCGTCIDRSTTELRLNASRGTWETTAPSFSIGLSSSSSSSASLSASFLDQFFARAAALPPPPTNRRVALDPTDTSTTVESSNLPKLDCCGGACLCPRGSCSCRASCGGACLDDHLQQLAQPIPPVVATPSHTPKSCCAGKRATAALSIA